jgi:hypothetical protein
MSAHASVFVYRQTPWIFLAAAVAFLASQPVLGEVIYSDPFTGTSGTIDGTTPASRGGIGAIAWTASNNLQLSSNELLSNNQSVIANAFLPFTPTAGNKYSLTLTLSTSGSFFDNYALFGFSQFNVIDSDFASTSVNGYAWWLQRTALASGNNYAFGGPRAQHLLNTDFLRTPQTRTIVLDTTQAQWQAAFFVNSELKNSYTYAVGENPTAIRYVGLSSANTFGRFDNFSFSAVPEPSSFIFVASLLGATARFRRRRKVGASWHPSIREGEYED